MDPTSRSIWPRIEHSINLGNKTIDDDRKDPFDNDATATNKPKRGKSKEEILKHHIRLDNCQKGMELLNVKAHPEENQVRLLSSCPKKDYTEILGNMYNRPLYTLQVSTLHSLSTKRDEPNDVGSLPSKDSPSRTWLKSHIISPQTIF